MTPSLLEPVRDSLVFHHVGIACRDLDAEEEAFSVLGYVREGAEFYDPIQGVYGRFLVGGGPRLEILRNREEPGVLSNWLKKGIRFYHLAYETELFDECSAAFAADGAKCVVAPVPAVAFGGRTISFYLMRNLTLVELIDRVQPSSATNVPHVSRAPL
jgi:methylmalonyl-CoA/ethylmalonyl-CoA epimerase